MSDIVLGIDLGTTNSVVSVADATEVRVLTDEGGSRLVPSVVSFHPDGRVLVGIEARERRLVDAANTVYSVKRLIGRPFRADEVAEAQRRFAFGLRESANGGVLVAIRNDTYTLTEISAFVLREVKRIAENALGSKVSKAVITVPAAFNELQRSATKAAGRVAGLEVLRIVNEPTAAALAYGIGRQRKERVAVFDLGGGTFDITLLELENDVFEVLGSAGDSFLGGDDFDLAVADVMADAFLAKHRVDLRTDEQAFERVRAAAEWLKCRLSTDLEATATVEELTHGPKGQPLDLVHTMTRDELEGRIRQHVTRAMDVCAKALADARLAASDLDAVILVGGSTRVPLVRRMVRDFFAIDPKVDIDPDLVVSQGAAIHGFAISGGKKQEKALARVALRRMTVADVAEVQKQRAELRANGPKQVAFAPELELEIPKAPPKRVAKPGANALDSRTRAGLGDVTEPFGSGPVQGAKVPALPKPKVRLSTMPPAPPHPIEVPDLGTSSRLALDDAFASPRPSAGAPSRPKPEGSGLLTLDGAFGSEPELAVDVAALDTAVRRASLRPPPASASSDGGWVRFDDLDEPVPAPASRADAHIPEAAIKAPLVPKIDPPADERVSEILELEPEPEELEPAALPAPEAAFEPIGAVLPMPAREAPILMDVTPLSLGLETVGGYCQTVIRRNVPIPCEQTRSFTTATDRQTTVTIRIYQGESRLVAENQLLGVIELSGLRPATRGDVRIAVTFEIDVSGILDVKAIDETTGESQSTRIRLLGGADDPEIDAMRQRQQRLVGAAS